MTTPQKPSPNPQQAPPPSPPKDDDTPKPGRPGQPEQQPEQPQQKALSREDAYKLAKKQSDERLKQSQEQNKDLREAKDDEEKASLRTEHAKARKELADRQKDERAKADPRGQMPTYNGFMLREKVAALHDDLAAVAEEHLFEVGELSAFGLEFDVFDPITGMVISPAQVHRRDIGQPGILMTTEAVISDIESARSHQQAHGVTAYSADHIMQ